MSVTTWIRLDPSARDGDLRTSLMARVADPLWLLARQWQLGERQGEDAGSPVIAELEGETNRLARYRPGRADASPPQAARDYDPRALPLEALVERERVREDARLDRRAKAEAGLHFLRLLQANGVSSLRSAYLDAYPILPLAESERVILDDESLVFFEMIKHRALDGVLLFVDLRAALRPATGTPALPANPPIPPADVGKVTAAALAYLDWYESLFTQPASDERAWSGERMEYSFAVSAGGTGGEVVLSAPAYSSGRLDWHDVDLDRSGTTLAGSDPLPEPEPVHLSVEPAPVTFKGMPAHRFWEFEDSQVDLGALDVSPSDLPRLLLMEFAFLHGNDWFVTPWEIDVGSLARVTSLKVTDTFGDVTTVNSARDLDPGWAMFRQSETGASAGSPSLAFKDLLFLAPTVVGGLTGHVLEEVVLARDEMANLSWAIERRVSGVRGRGFDRHDAFVANRRRNPPPPPPPPDPDQPGRRYVPQTTIPDYWLPLVPVRVPGSDIDFRYRRGLLDRPGGPVAAQGRILEPEHALILHEEEVPRIGLRVTRSFDYARWTGGQSLLWIGRRKVVSHGEASSGLRYDTVE